MMSENAKIFKMPKQLPWIEPMNCEGCGDCVNKCKNGHLKMTATNIEGIFVPWLREPELCSGCGLCASSCVMGGIMMTEYVDMAFNRFKNKQPRINRD